MGGINGLVFRIDGKDYILQQAALVWLGLAILLAIFFFYASNKIKHADPTKAPKGIVYLSLELYNIVLFIIQGNLKKRTNKYLPLYGTLILMMVMANLIGLVGLQPPTSNLGINVTIALCMWLLIQGKALKDRGIVGRFKELLEPFWLLFPLNVIGESVLPLSLSMRLFGNILSGTIIMTMVYSLFSLLNKVAIMLGVSIFLVTPILHMYFDIFSGLIQTYVFFTIASFFFGQAGDNE